MPGVARENVVVVPLYDEVGQLADQLDSLTLRLRGAETLYDALRIVNLFKAELETFAFAMPSPVSVCEKDGSPVWEAQGENGPFRYCAYGHRWS